MKSLKSLVGVAFVAAIVPAQAAVTFYFNDPIAASPMPGGSPSFAQLDIVDSGADTVMMTLTHNASSAAGQFISELNLNMSPFAGDASASYSSPKISGISFNEDGVNDAGSNFDMSVKFVTSNANSGANRLKPGESASWTVTGTGVDETDFMALSGGTARYGLIHMQNIYPTGGSTKLSADPVPEPASLTALALGAAALLRKRSKK